MRPYRQPGRATQARRDPCIASELRYGADSIQRVNGMAEADIAFAAAAGAAGVALAVSAWAWRLRRVVGLRESMVERERAEAASAVAGSIGALAAFGDVRIGLPAVGAPVVFGDAEGLAAACEAFCTGDAGPGDAEPGADAGQALALALQQVVEDLLKLRDHVDEQEDQDAENVDPVLRAVRKAAGEDVDADVLVLSQHVGGTEQEDGREQIPLDFQEGVGTPVDRVAGEGVEGATEPSEETTESAE
jgi:hypothetical protein